jgi:hypothetical protein
MPKKQENSIVSYHRSITHAVQFQGILCADETEIFRLMAYNASGRAKALV